jgi:hypothetical protein
MCCRPMRHSYSFFTLPCLQTSVENLLPEIVLWQGSYLDGKTLAQKAADIIPRPDLNSDTRFQLPRCSRRPMP